MKIRMTSLALAGVMAGTLILPAFAAEEAKNPVEAVSGPGIYLEGERADTLEFQLINGVNYITLESFMALMDEEAVLEYKENGTVVATSTVVTGLEDEDVQEEQPEEAEDQEAENAADDQQTAEEGAGEEEAQHEEAGEQPSQETEDEAQPAEDETQIAEEETEASEEDAQDETEAAQPTEEDEQPAEEGEQPAEENQDAAEGEQPAEEDQDAAEGEQPAEEEQPEEDEIPADAVVETLTLSAVPGSLYVQANGRYLYVKDGLKQVNGKLAVPVRVLAKIYNLDVGYDGATGNVTLTHQAGTGAFLQNGATYYNGDTLYWLSHIIYAESGNQPMLGKIAVGNVVMNRVASPLFPNNIYDVLFQRNQFSPAISGSIYRDPNADSVVAAKLVMDGAVALENVLFFNRAGLNSYASRNRPYVATIGAHAFYA